MVALAWSKKPQAVSFLLCSDCEAFSSAGLELANKLAELEEVRKWWPLAEYESLFTLIVFGQISL